MLKIQTITFPTTSQNKKSTGLSIVIYRQMQDQN